MQIPKRHIECRERHEIGAAARAVETGFDRAPVGLGVCDLGAVQKTRAEVLRNLRNGPATAADHIAEAKAGGAVAIRDVGDNQVHLPHAGAAARRVEFDFQQRDVGFVDSGHGHTFRLNGEPERP